MPSKKVKEPQYCRECGRFLNHIIRSYTRFDQDTGKLRVVKNTFLVCPMYQKMGFLGMGSKWLDHDCIHWNQEIL